MHCGHCVRRGRDGRNAGLRRPQCRVGWNIAPEPMAAATTCAAEQAPHPPAAAIGFSKGQQDGQQPATAGNRRAAAASKGRPIHAASCARHHRAARSRPSAAHGGHAEPSTRGRRHAISSSVTGAIDGPAAQPPGHSMRPRPEMHGSSPVAGSDHPQRTSRQTPQLSARRRDEKAGGPRPWRRARREASWRPTTGSAQRRPPTAGLEALIAGGFCWLAEPRPCHFRGPQHFRRALWGEPGRQRRRLSVQPVQGRQGGPHGVRACPEGRAGAHVAGPPRAAECDTQPDGDRVGCAALSKRACGYSRR